MVFDFYDAYKCYDCVALLSLHAIQVRKNKHQQKNEQQSVWSLQRNHWIKMIAAFSY